MVTNVTVNVKIVIPISHPASAVESFVEKLGKDRISDILINANKKIEIKEIRANADCPVKG